MLPVFNALLIAATLTVLTCASAMADDAVVNTPTILAALKGQWELQPRNTNDYKQRLVLAGSAFGQWHKSESTLPISITFYVEGNELLLQHYYEPNGAFNYRMKQIRFRYKLGDNELALTLDGETQRWKRATQPISPQPVDPSRSR